MNKKLLLVLFALCFYKINAQVSINNYIYSTSTTASLARSNGSLIDDIDMSTGTTVVLGGSAITNTVSSAANLNFDFYSGGTRFTNFTVTPNGWVGLGGGVSPAILWSGAVFSGTRIAPFLGPLLNTNVPPLSSMTTSSIGRVHYKVVGTSPSRVGVIEFLRMSVNSSVVDDTTTFQVRLYESNGAIEMVYGRMKVTVGAPLDFNIGFKIAAGSHSVNTSNNTSSTIATNTNTFSANTFIPNLHNYTSGSQRAYRFTPIPPNDPTNFNITNVTNNSMTLGWADASNETGYVLYRSLDGGSTYTFVQQFGANTISYNATGLPGGTDVYWRLYSMRESLGTQVDNMATTLNSSIITSITDGNWNSATTWSSGTIPTANDSVTISAGDTVTLISGNSSCLRLNVNGALHYSINANITLSISNDLIVSNTGAVRDFWATVSSNTLNIGGASTASLTNGSIVNNGIIDIDNSTQGVNLNMFGNGYATITGSPTVFQLRNLQLQKNNNINNIVEVFTPFSVALTTNVNTLTIQSGTLKLSCAINITPYGSPNSSILVNSAQGRLWLNHANAVVNSTTTVSTSSLYQLIGELRIDNGTLNIGAGNSQFLVGTSKIIINNGTFNLLGSFQATSTGTLEMNGGALNINPITGIIGIPATTAAFLLSATSSLTWTGGTINVINPQTLSNNVSVNILAGGNKLITGGLLKIGNGLQNSTGASNINTAGFGLTSEVPLYDVLLDCRYDLSSGRLVRIVGNFIVGRNLTIATGTSVLPASGAVGGNLTLRRQLINNGLIIGNFPILTAPIVGLVTFDGDSAQLISGSGTFSNLANLTINNINGVTNSSSTFGNVVRLNLLTGLLTTNGTLTIGASNSRGTIQIGGVNETTPAGSLSSVPLFNLTFTSHRYIYAPSSSTLVTGAFNEMPTGSSATLSSLTITDLNGLSSNKTLSILDTLNLGVSNLNINNNNLTIGSGLSQVGILIRTTGFVQLGSASIFRRWYATGSVLDNTLTSGFPILSSNQDRSVSLNSDGNTLTTGGSFSVSHQNIVGYTNITPSVTDGIVNVNRVSNSYWFLGLSGITVPSFYGLQVNAQMQGVGSVASLNELRLMKPSLGSGNTSTGLGTLNSPIISRLFSQTQVSSGVLNDTFYVGVNNTTNTLTPTYIAITNGSWDNPNTWNNNSVPNSNNIVVIPSPYTVNLNTSTSFNFADSLAILPGGKLSIDANTLTISRNVLCDGILSTTSGILNISGIDQAGLTIGLAGSLNISGGKVNIADGSITNRTLTANGIVNLSDSGEINMFGNVLFNAGSTFIQTGGDFKIDGNSGTAFTSLLSGKHLLDINTDNINCSGGNITFIDPPHSSLSALSTYTLRIAATSNLSAFSGTHTFIFGDGISTTFGNNSGFNVDNRKSGIVPIKNIIVNGGSGTGRWLSPSYTSGSFGLYALGNLTINSGSEVRQTNASQLVIGGNIMNSGTLTITQTITLGGLGYNVLNAQTIGGNGVFRNATSSANAAFTSMVINNGGTTFNLVPNTIGFSAGLTLTNGLVNAGTKTIKIPATASISRTNGYITAGALELNFATGTNVTKTYFVGGSNGYTPTILTFPSVTTAGDVRLTLGNTDHPQISSACFDNNQSINKNWNINNISVAPYLLNANLSYTSADIDAGTTISSIIGKKYDGTSWSIIPMASVSGTNTIINGLNSNGTIQLADTVNASVSISISTANTTACYGTNVTYTATAGGSSPNYQWKKNGTNVGFNSDTYVNSNVTKTDTVWCIVSSNLACASVLNATSNILIVVVGNPGQSTGLTSTYTNTSEIHICHGSNTGLLTFSKDLPVNIIRWDTMNTRVSGNWGPVSNTSATYTSGPLNAYAFDYGNRSLPNYANFKVIYNYVGCTDTTESNVMNFVVDPTTVIKGLFPGIPSSPCIDCLPVCYGTKYHGGFFKHYQSVYNSSFLQESVAPFTTWNTLNLDSMIELKRIRVIATSGVCPADTQLGLEITVTDQLIAGTLNGNQTICKGSPSGIVYTNGTGGFIANWRYSFAPYTTWNDLNNSSQITNMPVLQTTKFAAAISNNYHCNKVYSDTVTVTVNPLSVGGAVAGGTTICAGNTSGLLTLSGDTGSVVRWESSVSPFTTWTTISNTSRFYTSGALTQTTQFRAVVQSGTCTASNSNFTTVTVNPTSNGGNIIGSNSICSGSSGGTLGLFDNVGNVIRWESSVTPFTSWSPINNISNFLILGNLNDSTKYRAVVQSANCAIGYSSVANIDVSPSVVAGTVNGPNNICSGSNPGSLVLTGNVGNVVRWESAVSPFIIFSPISNTTTSYNPGALTQTTQFRAVVQSGSCGTATTSALTINISTSVSGGNVSAPFTAVCSGITPTQSVSLNGFSGSVTTWQMATGTVPYTWSNISGSASLSSIIPSAATVSTAYRALVQSGSCGSAVSDSVVIAVNAPSVGGSLTSNAPVCVNSNAILTLTSNVGNVVRWESAVAPFTNFVTISSTNNPYTSSFGITETTVFRAVVKSGVCAETNSTSHSVTINNITEWLGTTDTNWHEASNWTCGVPTINSTVGIASHVATSWRTPTISTVAYANDISIYGGCHASACLTVQRGVIKFTNSGTLNLNGDILTGYGGSGGSPGRFEGDNGTLNLIGNDTQKFYISIPIGSYEPISLGNVVVNGAGLKYFKMTPTINGVLNLINGKIYSEGDVVISPTGSIIGGNANSFIQAKPGLASSYYHVGYLIQKNIGLGGRTGNIFYPVGYGSLYHPFYINNIGVADDYTGAARDLVSSSYPNGYFYSFTGTMYYGNAVQKTISISEKVAGGSNLTVTIQWNASEEGGGFSRSSCYVARHNGGLTNVWYSSPAGSASGTGPYSRSLSGITVDLTTANLFSVGSGGTLPVKWIRFNGVLANKITNLTWATASEINNKGFEVERSFNGTDFENIGFEKGAGNSNKVNGYEFPDNLSTTNYLNSTIYYRLKQLDFDGNFEYSNIITVKDNEFIEFGKDVTITPNPFTNEIQLNFSSANNATVKLILLDALGREIYNKNLTAITGTNNLVIDDLTVLKSGVYFARLESNGVVTKTVKLLKN